MLNVLNGLADSIMNMKYCCTPEVTKGSDEAAGSPDPPNTSLDRIAMADLRSQRASPRKRYKAAFENTRSVENFYDVLLTAAQNRETILLISHIQSGGRSIHDKNETGNTVLHLAARDGHQDIVELLCQVIAWRALGMQHPFRNESGIARVVKFQ
jgi:ankyrin repeat protein